MSQKQTPERAPMDEKSSKGISRREFARRAAIASAVASWAPVQAVTAAPSPQPAQAPRPLQPAQTPQGPGQTPQAPNLPKLSPESQAEVDARVQAILGQYGSRFSDEQKADLRRLCTMAQPQLDRLRAYNIENGVSPALYLKPLVEREKKPAPLPALPHAASPTAPATNAPPTAKPPAAPKEP
jgi:hypothetical protein